MLRKIVHISVVFVVLFATIGITLSKHYCHGTLKKVEINSIPESCCDDEGCCRNEMETFKLNTDYNVSFQYISFEKIQPLQLFFVEIQNIMLNSFEFTTNAVYTYNFSPPPQSVGYFLSKIQVFLI